MFLLSPSVIVSVTWSLQLFVTLSIKSGLPFGVCMFVSVWQTVPFCIKELPCAVSICISTSKFKMSFQNDRKSKETVMDDI